VVALGARQAERVAEPPPPSRVLPAGQDAVTCAALVAAAGPGTCACAIPTFGSSGPLAHSANACVALPWSPPPPLSPTAVHDVGLAPSTSGLPAASLGKLPFGLRLPTVPGVVRAPPLSKRVPGGQVAVACTVWNVPDGPGVLATTTCVAAGPASRHSA